MATPSRRPAARSIGSTFRTIGIKGNGHMMMQDKNNKQIAEVIQKWLVGKGLVD